jgi:hypothetical protein
MLATVQTYSVPSHLGPLVGSVPLLSGQAGTAQTIDLARKLVEQAVRDPQINRLAIDIVRHTPQYDDLAKAEAIYNWVCANFTYIQDPVGPNGPKEALRPVRDLLELRAGDCDDINLVLFPALLGTIGYSTRAITIAGDPAAPREFTHVYCEVDIDGEWIPMDAARSGASFGEAPPYYFARKAWPITNANEFSLLGHRPLAGYVGNSMGADITGKDIQAIEAGAAQIISAANQNPYSYQYYGSLDTAAAPGNVSPQIGYGVSGQVQASSWLPILGVGIFFLLLVRGKK